MLRAFKQLLFANTVCIFSLALVIIKIAHGSSEIGKIHKVKATEEILLFDILQYLWKLRKNK